MSRKLLSCLLGVLCLGVLTAAPERSKKKRFDFTLPTKVEVATSEKPATTASQKELRSQACAKQTPVLAPVESGDTVYITDEDLPFRVQTKFGLSPTYELRAQKSLKIAVSVRAAVEPSSAIWLKYNDKTINIGEEVLINSVQPTERHSFSPSITYGNYIGTSCELVIDTVGSANVLAETVSGIPYTTVDALPFSKTQAPTTVNYLRVNKTSAYGKLYRPIAASFFVNRANDAPVAHIKASDNFWVYDRKYSTLREVNKSIDNIAPGAKNVYMIRGFDGSYSVEMAEGKLPYITTEKGIEEFTPITLPYSYCGVCTNKYASGKGYTAYSFELTESAKIYLPCKLYSVKLYSEDAQIVVNNFLSEEIPAGKYYVLVEDYGYSEESCIKIEAKPTTATIPDYDGLVYDTPLTVGNPEFGTLSMLDDPLMYNNEEDWGGYADAFKVELTPGFYRVAGSVTGVAGEYKDAALFMFSQITGDYSADLINQSMNGGGGSKVTSEFEFVVDSACTYYIYLSSYSDASGVDYELVVEKVKGFTELTIPCRINGTIAPGSELYNEMMMGDLTTDGFYSVYIPQDTILKFKASVTNESGNPIVVAFDKGDRMPVIGVQIENNEILLSAKLFFEVKN